MRLAKRQSSSALISSTVNMICSRSPRSSIGALLSVLPALSDHLLIKRQGLTLLILQQPLNSIVICVMCTLQSINKYTYLRMLLVCSIFRDVLGQSGSIYLTKHIFGTISHEEGIIHVFDRGK